MQRDSYRVALSGELDEFREALEAEIEAAKRDNIESAGPGVPVRESQGLRDGW